MLMRLIFPAMLVVAVFLLLRGHDLPGGGFSAGMVVAIAIILQYMIGGTDWTEDRLRLLPAAVGRRRVAGRGWHRARGAGLRQAVPHHLFRLCRPAAVRQVPTCERAGLRHRRLRAGRGIARC
jgi:hypothetical protein